MVATALSYRAILSDYLAGDLVDDHLSAYRADQAAWRRETVRLPEEVFEALDAGHGVLQGFDPDEGDADRLRRALGAVLGQIDVALGS